MGLYDLGKEQRLQLVDQINGEVLVDLQKGKSGNIVIYCSDDDTYIRKTVYLAVGKICHGIELRGRTHPQNILPLLKELQFDRTARVKNTLIHVLGQIAYKKGCLETVVEHLKLWENKELVLRALDEIIDVHGRYKDFTILTQKQAVDFIDKHYKLKGRG